MIHDENRLKTGKNELVIGCDMKKAHAHNEYPLMRHIFFRFDSI